jgi:hypothetical protein
MSSQTVTVGLSRSDLNDLLRAQSRIVAVLERIAAAMEARNAADPLLAIERALAGEVGDGPNEGPLTGIAIGPHLPNADADMPPHIKRALGLE